MKVFYTEHLTKFLDEYRNYFARIRKKFWWIDVLYPLALAIMIFGSLTIIVYGGRESTRLSLLGERFLLEWSLKYTPDYELKNSQDILVVTASPVESKYFRLGHFGKTPDMPLEIYIRLLEVLKAQGIKKIVFIWRSENGLIDSKKYLIIKELIEKHNDVEVIIGSALNDVNAIKNLLGPKIQVFGSIPCANSESGEAQTYCPIIEQNKDWMGQWIFENFYPQSSSMGSENKDALQSMIQTLWPHWKTKYVPSTVESYITRFPRPDLLTENSVSQVLNPTTQFRESFKVAFVGVDLMGAVGSLPEGYMPISVKLARPGWEAYQSVPLHKYWALLAQSLLEEKAVYVASPVMIWLLNLVLGFSILYLVYRFNSLVSAVFFTIWCIVAPCINIIFIEILNFYYPIFSTYYIGITTLTISGFARLSYTALGRWRAEEKSKSHLHAADLKGNFISLLSHNINTPIAKMQGMLDLLAMSKVERSANLQCAGFHLSQLQLVIKSVLVATTLEEQAIPPNLRPLGYFLEDFHQTFKPLIKQLGVTFTLKPIEAEFDDLLHLPLGFDSRVLGTTLAALVGLGVLVNRTNIETQSEAFQSPGLTHFVLESHLCERPSGLSVIFKFKSSCSPLELIERWITEAKQQKSGFRSLRSQDFVRGVLSSLVALTMDHYRGSFMTNSLHKGLGEFSLELFPAAR